MEFNLAGIPDDLMPTVDELPGDLALLARIIEDFMPGVGVQLTMRIAEEFRGTSIYCHNIDRIYQEARNRWLKEQHKDGDRVPNLARTVGLSERQVWTILGREPGEDKQMKLFD